MKTIKRFLLLSLVGFLAAVVIGPPVASGAETPGGETSSALGIDRGVLTNKQKRAKKKALRKCNKKSKAKKRKKCKRRIRRKYRKIARNNPPPIGKTWKVLVGEGGNFYSPSTLTIKKNDAIKWSWENTTAQHNVTLVEGPEGVDRSLFSSQLTSSTDYRFKRQFTKTGSYSFVCSIHVLMTMDVEVVP